MVGGGGSVCVELTRLHLCRPVADSCIAFRRHVVQQLAQHRIYRLCVGGGAEPRVHRRAQPGRPASGTFLPSNAPLHTPARTCQRLVAVHGGSLPAVQAEGFRLCTSPTHKHPRSSRQALARRGAYTQVRQWLTRLCSAALGWLACTPGGVGQDVLSWICRRGRRSLGPPAVAPTPACAPRRVWAQPPHAGRRERRQRKGRTLWRPCASCLRGRAGFLPALLAVHKTQTHVEH